MSLTITQKLTALGGDVDALIEKLGRVQGTTEAGRSQIAGLLDDLATAQAEQAATAQQIAGLAGPVRDLRAGLAEVADAAKTAGGSLRGIGTAGGGPSVGGMKTLDPALMSTAALEDLARALKPAIDKISARSK